VLCAAPAGAGVTTSLPLELSFNAQDFTSSGLQVSYTDPFAEQIATAWSNFSVFLAVLGVCLVLYTLMCTFLSWQRNLAQGEQLAQLELARQHADAAGPDVVLARGIQHYGNTFGTAQSRFPTIVDIIDAPTHPTMPLQALAPGVGLRPLFGTHHRMYEGSAPVAVIAAREQARADDEADDRVPLVARAADLE
jgi:hypothetical protein